MLGGSEAEAGVASSMNSARNPSSSSISSPAANECKGISWRDSKQLAHEKRLMAQQH